MLNDDPKTTNGTSTKHRLLTSLVALTSAILPSCDRKSALDEPVFLNAEREALVSTGNSMIPEEIVHLKSVMFELEKEGRALFGIRHTWQLPHYTPEFRRDEAAYTKFLFEKYGDDNLPINDPNFVRTAIENGFRVDDFLDEASAYVDIRLWFSNVAMMINELSDPSLAPREQAEIVNRLDLEASTTAKLFEELDKIRLVIAPEKSK